jgi:hypothetical protein
MEIKPLKQVTKIQTNKGRNNPKIREKFEDK